MNASNGVETAAPFPVSASSLIFPSASHGLSSTLSSLKRSTLSTSNRLQSIYHDSLFVEDVASQYGLPVISNERCGSWYVPLEKKAASAYFKSTDGHWGQWTFSRRRLNLHISGVIGRHGGWVRICSLFAAFSWIRHRRLTNLSQRQVHHRRLHPKR